MLFKNIIGLTSVKQHLVEMLQQNRLSHALLFLGKEGSGALPMALAFAQLVVSQPPPAVEVADLFGGFSALEPTPSFVGSDEIESLPAFQRAEQMIHPDLHYTFPVVPRKTGDKPKSSDYIQEWREFVKESPYGNVYDWLQFIKAENKQGNITAEECNDIMRKLNLKSYEGEYKVLVVWMAEYLGKEGNKLLKLIEEPPANTLFILVAENEELVLPTILSRCQLVKIPRPEPTEIQQALEERMGVESAMAVQIAAICEGNYREALQMNKHAEEDWQTMLKDWLNATLKGGPMAQVKFVETIAALGREKQKQFLRFFNHLLEQSIRLKVLGTERMTPISDSERDFAQRINKIASVSQIYAVVEELDRSSYYIERNANGKILFLALTIRLRHILQNKVTFQM